ncbi:MAG: hypothetical protein HRT67_09075 [Flavobacteriaceae bacterium]|nr:hypothetical protein [Flavobacteriaceae bacterium]
MKELDAITINFDTNVLGVLNTALALVMFGVTLSISTEDFKHVIKHLKTVLIGVLS